MPNLLFCIGKAIADRGLGSIAAALADPTLVSATNLIGQVAAGAWKVWRGEKKQDKLNEDILAAAKLSFDDAKQAAIEIARQVATDPELQGHVERFVTLMPASIRASLRRPEDLTGTTVPAGYAVNDSEDLVKLMPVRLPRFKPGDAPAFLRGWRLIEQVGAGGFGEVWKAQNIRATNLVNAVKFGHGLSDAEQSLLNEGDVLNRLLAEGHHDGIVKLLDMWTESDAVPWLRYEFISGGDLTARIHEWQSQPAAERIDNVLDALTQLTGTVGHFHGLTPFIVHRDLKPSNILYDPKGKRYKVGDFGIGAVSSRRMLAGEGSRSLTAGAVLASYLRGSHTPLYASPEQRVGSRVLDPRQDVYSLGVIAYQMVTGQLDAAPGSDAEYDLRDRGAPDGLIDLIKGCTARDPNRRPKDAGEMHRQLQALARSSAPVKTNDPTPVVPAVPPPPTVMAKQVEPTPAITADPVTEFAKWKAQVAEVTAQAERAADVFDYSRAVTLYAGLPAKRRDEGKLTQWTTKRDRLAAVWGEVESGWKEMSEDELVERLEEVLALHPDHPKAKRWLLQFGTAEDRRKAKEASRKAGERMEVALPGGVKMSFAWCPAGTFLMGSPATEKEREDEEQQHEVKLTRGFWIGVHPVTRAQYQAVMGTNPSHFNDDMLPVEQVSWEDAVAFCVTFKQKTGVELRLPTEAEWEYAARGWTRTPFYWGEQLNGTQANCRGNEPYGTGTKGLYLGKTTPVGSYAGKYPHPWGLTDVIGNVWEWCSDWYDGSYYAKSPKEDPTGPESGSGRVCWGGSWGSNAGRCRAAGRGRYSPGYRGNFLGFRLAVVPSGQ